MAEKNMLKNINDERTARAVLSYVFPPDHPLTGRLLYDYGAVQTIRFAENQEPPGVDAVTLRVWRDHFDRHDPSAMARGLELADENGLSLLMPGDENWPTGVNDLRERAPYALWARGAHPELLSGTLSSRVSMAGSRASSTGGMFDADHLALGLALRDVTIAAAASRGIARTALAATIGSRAGAIVVMGSGLDHPYPHLRNGFFETVAENGVILSETPPGFEPTRDTLRGISRIVGALSAVTALIESGPRGNAMETVREARELGRRIVAVRGPEGEISSIGPNLLIDEGLADPVMDRNDILAALESFERKTASPGTGSESLLEAQSAQLDHDRPGLGLRAPLLSAARTL